MDELIRTIELFVSMELERANKINAPKFHSNHEGYAVILEELQEAEQEMSAINEQMRHLWEGIKRNDEVAIVKRINLLKKRTTFLIAESVQTAAMIQKLIDSSEEN